MAYYLGKTTLLYKYYLLIQHVICVIKWIEVNVRCVDIIGFYFTITAPPLSAIFQLYLAVSYIGGGNRSTRRKSLTFPKSLIYFISLCCIEYTSSWTGFELATLVVIGTDCTGSCKSNHHTITTTTAPPSSLLYEQTYQHHWLYKLAFRLEKMYYLALMIGVFAVNLQCI